MPAVSAVISTGESRSRLPRSTICLGEPLALLLHQVEVVGDEQDAVADRDAAERDEPDQARHRQRLLGDDQREHAADERRRGWRSGSADTIRTDGNSMSSTKNMPTRPTPRRGSRSAAWPASWLSNCPPYSTKYPAGIDPFLDTRRSMSATAAAGRGRGVAADHRFRRDVLALDLVRPGGPVGDVGQVLQPHLAVGRPAGRAAVPRGSW